MKPLRTLSSLTLTLAIGFGHSWLLLADCPSASTDKPWPIGKVVHVNISYLPGDLQPAAATAVDRMNSGGNPGGVSFVNGGGNEIIALTATSIAKADGTPSVSGLNVTSRDASGYLQSAQVFIPPTFVIPGANVPALDSSQPGYQEALTDLFMHEFTHLLGLNDAPIPDPGNLDTCGGQTQGGSIMNAFCGTNNQGFGGQAGSMAQSLTPCDEVAMTSWYSETQTTDDNQISHANGEDCYENWDITIWGEFDGSNWNFDHISWDQYNYKWCAPAY